jgi:hypothetical protein
MKTEKDEIILEFWKEFEQAEPDISTERLLAMTADAANVSTDDVVISVLYFRYRCSFCRKI